jgi:hypothetical protein
MDSNPQIKTSPKRGEAGLGLGDSDDRIDDGMVAKLALGWIQGPLFPRTVVLKARRPQPIS